MKSGYRLNILRFGAALFALTGSAMNHAQQSPPVMIETEGQAYGFAGFEHRRYETPHRFAAEWPGVGWIVVGRDGDGRIVVHRLAKDGTRLWDEIGVSVSDAKDRSVGYPAAGPMPDGSIVVVWKRRGDTARTRALYEAQLIGTDGRPVWSSPVVLSPAAWGGYHAPHTGRPTVQPADGGVHVLIRRVADTGGGRGMYDFRYETTAVHLSANGEVFPDPAVWSTPEVEIEFEITAEPRHLGESLEALLQPHRSRHLPYCALQVTINSQSCVRVSLMTRLEVDEEGMRWTVLEGPLGSEGFSNCMRHRLPKQIIDGRIDGPATATINWHVTPVVGNPVCEVLRHLGSAD